MKLSDLKDEAALDALADLIEPSSEIMTDKEVVALFKSGQRTKAISKAIKNHKKAVITILAISEGENPEEYQPSVLSLPAKLLEIFNDKEMLDLFRLQGQ